MNEKISSVELIKKELEQNTGKENGIFTVEAVRDLLNAVEGINTSLNRYRDDIFNLVFKKKSEVIETEIHQPRDIRKPVDLVYNGYSSHDDESHYKCPVCGQDYGSWEFYRKKLHSGSTFVCSGRGCAQLLRIPFDY